MALWKVMEWTVKCSSRVERAFCSNLSRVVFGGASVVVSVGGVVLVDEVALEAAGLAFDFLGVAEVDEEAEGF